jgi:hypothetical protein
MRRLSGQERRQLQTALMSAFPGPADLEMLLDAAVDKQLAHLAPANANYRATTFAVLKQADAGGWTARLVAGARAEQPGNPELAAIAETLGIAPHGSSRLESIISEQAGLHDVVDWRTALWRIEGQVCRIESTTRAGGRRLGTGFLVGPDLVMTNHHVVARVIQGDDDPAKTCVRFDYKRLEDGAIFDTGMCCDLASDWLLSSSPPSPSDESGEGLPSPEQLDYALLRLTRPVGTEAARAPGTLEPGPRGWVAIPEAAPPPEIGSALVIVQHPEAGPMQLAVDVVLGRNENGTRLRYRTNTSAGSSGAPCFDLDWRLECLHHSGDPNYASLQQPHYNQGIPIGAIRAHLDTQGLLDELVPPTPAR